MLNILKFIEYRRNIKIEYSQQLVRLVKKLNQIQNEFKKITLNNLVKIKRYAE